MFVSDTEHMYNYIFILRIYGFIGKGLYNCRIC